MLVAISSMTIERNSQWAMPPHLAIPRSGPFPHVERSVHPVLCRIGLCHHRQYGSHSKQQHKGQASYHHFQFSAFFRVARIYSGYKDRQKPASLQTFCPFFVLLPENITIFVATFVSCSYLYLSTHL